MIKADPKIKRIGIFYDGNYFARVSSYYNYHHERRSRISISGFHDFLRAEVARQEETEARFCQVVDAHYYRGRLKAAEAEQRDVLLSERQFDDVLVREGVVAHYLPMGPGGEKGIDVLLALEAFEFAMYKHYDVVVLVTADGDFLPLVRKLNSIGVRVMITAWDIKFFDMSGVERETRTSHALLDEAAYPLLMHKIIDSCVDADASGLFIRTHPMPQLACNTRGIVDVPLTSVAAVAYANPDVLVDGVVASLKESSGYGFIRPDGAAETLFFHASSLSGCEFSELAPGSRVRFTIGQTDRGLAAKTISLRQPSFAP